MSEHLLFLQAAGSDFGSAHDLVAAVGEIVRAPQGEHASGEMSLTKRNHSGKNTGHAKALDPDRVVERFARAGCEGAESLVMALSVLTTISSPSQSVDINWIKSVADRIGDEDLLLETAGVIFAFNTINRIADARRVKLEYRFLRQLVPIRGWIERALASLTSIAYDMTFKYQARYTSAESLDRVGVVFKRLGATTVPDVFNWLSRSPVVLEGILEMLESNVTNAMVRSDLLKEAVAIGVASRAMPGSDLRKSIEHLLPAEALPDSKSLKAWATASDDSSESKLVSASRQYAWRVANAAYTITDEQIQELSALGLSDAEILDLTLATAAFSALAIIEPISAAAAPASIATGKTSTSTKKQQVQVQLV